MKSMFKKQKKFDLKLKLFSFLFISPFLFSLPKIYLIEEAKAALEFQWDQSSGFKRLKWFQKESKKNFRNTIYYFLRPGDRDTDFLKIDFAIPKTFKTNIKNKNISLCKVKIGGFESRTKCLEDIPIDIEIENENEESSLKRLNIYPFAPLPSNKDSYAVVLKVINPNRSGLYQFHSFVQPTGKTSTSYLGSWTIVID
tara:strand:+ start:438 stop:1031 length:594 start_codon:yes stop_codon:yes gene_type:complete